MSDSIGVQLAKNKQARTRCLDDAGIALRGILVETAYCGSNQTRLSEIDFAKVDVAIEQLKAHKAHMRALIDEYDALVRLQG